MSAFGRSRRQVYLDADLVELLRVAAPKERLTIKDMSQEELNAELSNWNSTHTPDTLLRRIVKDWFEMPENVRYKELVVMREAAIKQADKDWASRLEAERSGS